MSDRYMSVILTAVLFVVVTAMMVMALDFNEQARRIPLFVGVPTAIGLALQLVREFLGFKVRPELADASVAADDAAVAETTEPDEAAAASSPATSAAATSAPATSAPATSAAVEQATSKSRTERVEIEDARVTAPVAFAWIGALTLSFYVFGLMVTVPLFIVPFMRIYGRESWKLIAAVVVGMLATLHLLFVVLLEMRLYNGLLGEWLDL